MSVDSSDRDICRDFLRNACSRGSRCRYQHKMPTPVLKSGELAFCRDFQNGTCKRTTCKYIHVSRAEEEQYRSSGTLPMQIQSLGIPLVNQTSSFPLPTLPVESSPDIVEAFPAVGSNSISTADICRDFLRGSCNRADRCKFRHVNPADIASSLSALTQPPSPSPMITDQLGQFLQTPGSIPMHPNLSSPFSILPPGVQLAPPFTGNSLLPPGFQCPGLLPSLPLLSGMQPVVNAPTLLPFPLSQYPDASSMMEKEIDRSGSPSPVHSSESGFGTTGHKAETAQVAPPDAGKSNSGGKRKRANSGSVSNSSPTMKNQRNTSGSSSATPVANSARNGNATGRGSHMDTQTQTQTATQTSPSLNEIDRTPSPSDSSASADKRHASNQTQSSGSKSNAGGSGSSSSKPSLSPKKHASSSPSAARGGGSDKGARAHSHTSDTSECSVDRSDSSAAANHTAGCHQSDADSGDLRRRVDQLMKQCSELVAANELLQEQNAFLRASCERRWEGERLEYPRGTCVMTVTSSSALDAAAPSLGPSTVTVGIPLQMPLPVATLPSSAMVPMSLISEAITSCISPGIAAVSAVASHPLILTSSPIIHTGSGATLHEAIPMQLSVQAVQPVQTMLPLHSFGSPQLSLPKLAIAATATPVQAAEASETKPHVPSTSIAEVSYSANAPRCSTPQSTSTVSSWMVDASSCAITSSGATASLTMTAIPATLSQLATMLPVATSMQAISALPMHTLPTTVTLTLPLHAVPVSSMAGVLRAQSHAVLDVASAKH